MLQGMTQESQLTVISISRLPQQSLDQPNLRHLRAEVFVQVGDRLRNDLELVLKEISQIILVRFGQQEGPCVLSWRPLEDLGYREIFSQPIPLREHGPVEKRARSSTVPVYEGMVVSYPEMQDDRSNSWMDEDIIGSIVGELAHEPEAFWQLVGGRWNMDNDSPSFYDDLVLFLPKRPSSRGIIYSVVGHKPMEIEKHVGR
jgi:hypothetical protein